MLKIGDKVEIHFTEEQIRSHLSMIDGVMITKSMFEANNSICKILEIRSDGYILDSNGKCMKWYLWPKSIVKPIINDLTPLKLEVKKVKISDLV